MRLSLQKTLTTIWQYYKLVGVQAKPVNGPPPAMAPTDDLSYYYLANIVVETNQTLQNFAGSVNDEGTPTPFLNVYLNGAPEVHSRWADVKVVTAHKHNRWGAI